jgi:hypothetical protein
MAYDMSYPDEAGKSIVTNNSLGSGWGAAYGSSQASYDSILELNPYTLSFFSTGNKGNEGWKSITLPSKSGKNMLAIACVSDVTRDASGNYLSGGTRESYSSRGPASDGRIKPDLAANGSYVYSTVNRDEYAYKSGTSMASPNAAGAAVLLQEYYTLRFSGEYMRSPTLKGLLIHTADDELGNSSSEAYSDPAGPDYKYGWGLLNAYEAGKLIKLAADDPVGKGNTIMESVLGEGETKEHRVYWDGVNPIRATLTWMDPAGKQSNTDALINDLNLKIIAGDGGEYLPFVMPYVLNGYSESDYATPATTGINHTDNTEQVRIATPSVSPPGYYTIVIDHVETLKYGTQLYSVILSGVTFDPALSLNNEPAFVEVSKRYVDDDAREGVAYSGSVAGFAADLDSEDTLTYSKVLAGSPAWLDIAADGALSGTPGAGDVGVNSFTVMVSDGNGGSAAGVILMLVESSGFNAPGSIGVNYSYGVGGNLSAGALAGAPGYEQMNWNNRGVFSGHESGLKDNLGMLRGMTVFLQGGSLSVGGAPTGTADGKLMNGFVHEFSVVVCRDIPFSSYDVLVYAQDGATVAEERVHYTLRDLNGVAISPTLYSGDFVEFGGWLELPVTATAPDRSLSPDGANYMVFKDVHLDAGSGEGSGFMMREAEKNSRDGMAAMQIVDTTPPADPYLEWVGQYPGIGDPARSADPDGDGFDNEYEYLFRMDPTSGGNVRAPRAGTLPLLGKNHLSLVYTRGIGTAVTYEFSTSSDLSAWSGYEVEGTDMIEVSVTDNGDGTEEVLLRYADNHTVVPRLFVRIRASE